MRAPLVRAALAHPLIVYTSSLRQSRLNPSKKSGAEWWANRRSAFECSVSQVVIDEASVGDAAEVQKRLAIIGSLPALEVTEAAEWDRAKKESQFRASEESHLLGFLFF